MLEYINEVVDNLNATIEKARESGVVLNVNPTVGSEAYEYQNKIKDLSRDLTFRVTRKFVIEQDMFEKCADVLAKGACLMGASQEGIFEGERVSELVELARKQEPPLKIPYRFVPYMQGYIPENQLNQSVRD